jgi:hypothetical protein
MVAIKFIAKHCDTAAEEFVSKQNTLFASPPRLASGRQQPRYFTVIPKFADEKLLAFFVCKFLSITLGRVQVSKRPPPDGPVVVILKKHEVKVR